MSDVHPIFKGFLDSVSKPPRFRVQLEIEDAISKFGPSFMEAGELVAAISGSLKARGMSADLEQCFIDLLDQLDEEFATECRRENEETMSQVNDAND